jgi:predicted RNase H-like HicB family nuclease
MKFTITIEPGGAKHAFGVVVPDLPGCFSAGDTLEEAMTNALEAIELTVETMIEDGQQIPAPQPISTHQKKREYKGWIWAVVDAPVEKFFGPAEKINITVPQAILTRIDSYAKSHGMSRSGFLVDAARRAMGGV